MRGPHPQPYQSRSNLDTSEVLPDENLLTYFRIFPVIPRPKYGFRKKNNNQFYYSQTAPASILINLDFFLYYHFPELTYKYLH